MTRTRRSSISTSRRHGAQFDWLESEKDDPDHAVVEAALDPLPTAIDIGETTMPATVEAVTAFATAGEIMGVFAEAHGRYQGTTGVA